MKVLPKKFHRVSYILIFCLILSFSAAASEQVEIFDNVGTNNWNVELSGPNGGTPGFSEQYSATVRNDGGQADNPGLLMITKDGEVEESEQTGVLQPGEEHEMTGWITFFQEGSKEICAEIEDGSQENCMTVNIDDTEDESFLWRELVNFRIDLTGPDSGLGWDMDSTWNPGMNDYTSQQIDFEQNRRVVYTDIYWQDTYEQVDDPDQQLTEADLLDVHEPPMCGDDEQEYLLEEMGQSINSEQFEGRYACADSNDYCVYRRPDGNKLFELEDKINTQQEGEDRGRSKQNEAVCAQRPGLQNSDTDTGSMSRPHDLFPQWYSQDYANNISGSGTISVPNQNICRENTLYGNIGVRWINYDYINEHPLAVNRGIDDSWNPRMDQMNHPYYISDPEGDYWDILDSEGPLQQGYSPIPTGTSSLYEGYDSSYSDKSVVADPTNMEYGFCAGDDNSEYLVYQDSNTRHLDTDQSKIGVTSSPNSCILDNSELSNIDEDDMESGTFSGSELQDERIIYQEGESVSFDSGDTRRSIACFGGQWWGDWPIVFLEDTAEFDLGETGFISFLVINPTDSSKDMELELNPRANDDDDREELAQMTSFESTGTDELEFTVQASSSTIQRLEVNANREVDTTSENGYDLEVFGISSDGSLSGADQVDLLIEEDEDLVGTSSQTRGIPGLTAVQLAVIALISSVIFFFSN